MADIKLIKALREETNVSMMECKKALDEANGDLEKAKKLLREWGQKIASKRADKEQGEGIICSYIHTDNKSGVLLDLRCETDFVAKGDDFKKLAHEICLQIVASNPQYIKEEDVPKEDVEAEKEIILNQMKDSADAKKPEQVKEKIVEGRLKKFMEERVLMNQRWIKDETKTITDLVSEYLAKIGEGIDVRRFTRYQI